MPLWVWSRNGGRDCGCGQTHETVDKATETTLQLLLLMLLLLLLLPPQLLLLLLMLPL